MGKASAPKAPDPYKTADAQGKLNKETASYQQALNRTNQSNPFGSISWAQTGTDPTTGAEQWGSTTTLSPELQRLFESQTGAQQGISDAISGAIGRLPTGAFDASGINTDNIRDASYNRQVDQLKPQFEEGWRNMQGTLSDRGIPLNSEISNNEYNRYDTARTGALTQASRQAELDAGAEQSRQFGQKMQEYNLPMQQLSQLMGNSSSVGNPQFGSTPQTSVGTPDLAGGIWQKYAADQQAYQQNQGNMMSGILGLGKLGLSAYTGGVF